MLLTTCYGLVAALVAVAFNVLTKLSYQNGIGALADPEVSKLRFVLVSLGIILGTSLIAGLMVDRLSRDAAGSGIPQLKLAFWKDFGMVRWRAAWVKFVAGVLTVGGGSSLGREGPTVHVGGGLTSILAGLLGEPKQNRRLAAASGAAAGLAAAFNTPLAAVTFVLEEIVQDLNSRLLGGVLLAGVVGALVVHGILGPKPAFELQTFTASGSIVYALTPLAAAFAALVGMVFQKQTMWLRGRQKTLRQVPLWARPALGALITWALGVGVFLWTGHLGVFGLGYGDLSDGLNNRFTWELAGALLVAKLIATIASYGFGGAGGIFAPTLFLGGMAGVLFSKLAEQIGVPLTQADHMVLAVVGMSGCLGAVVRAPVTGILIVFEMTHEWSLLPALMMGAIVSQAIARRFTKENFYDESLRQDGHRLERVIPPRDLHSWQQLPVSTIANFRPFVADDTSPEGLKKLLEERPHDRFPVVKEDRLVGVLTRKEAERCAASGEEPTLESAVTCLPNQTIRQLQYLLIDSPTFMVVVLDRPQGRVLGLVTLHDLLRAETAMSRRVGEEL